MSLNLNVDPYYDDFDPTKNYHRILFKPGYAVQARELTQTQTILQNQISSFADNIFKQNSPVTGGQITTNFTCNYIKLNTTINGSAVNVTNFVGLLITDASGTISAKVIAVSPGVSGGDPPTLIVSYQSGTQFSDNTIIYNLGVGIAQSIVSGSTGSSSVASIAQGVFYITGSYQNSSGVTVTTGNFVQVNPQIVVLDKYDNTPTMRVGLNISESIVSSGSDPSLLDPAISASNYQAPGADRYQITLNLVTKPVTFGDDSTFIPLLTINNGSVQKLVDGSVYNVIDDYFAKRDYETNGDYVVNDFKLTPKTTANDPLANTYTMSIGKGVAYVHGYRIENQASVDLVSPRARTTASSLNSPVYLSYGNFFYTTNVRGNNAIFFDTTTYESIDLHSVPYGSINTASASAYSSTVAATGYIRGLVFDHTSNTADATANSYVYRTYVTNLQNATLTGNVVTTPSSTSVTLPSTFSVANNAYVNATITINSGTDAGDIRTITAYNGASKVATVSQAWTISPDTTSQFTINFNTGNINSLVLANKSSYPATTYGLANIDNSSRSGGIATGITQIQNPSAPELIFALNNPYVANLTSTQYTSEILWRGVSVAAGVTTLDLTATVFNGGIVKHLGAASSTLSSVVARQNFTIVVTSKGNSSTINVGDVLPLTFGTRSIAIDSTGQKATITLPDQSAFNSIQLSVVENVYVSTADNGTILKTKQLITASNTSVLNTAGAQINNYTWVDTSSLKYGQVYIQNAGLVSPGNKQSLYLVDVKNIVKIVDTGSSGVAPTVANLFSYVDVTNNYILDNGQRDGYYDYASITLKPGATQPVGNILVLLNYYLQTGGDGYFSIQSYLASGESYIQIPKYVSTSGTAYSLRDCLDFRPSRAPASSLTGSYSTSVPAFILGYTNAPGGSWPYYSSGTGGILLPNDLAIFSGSYNYYLGRNDKLVLSKDKSFNIIQGAPSINPIYPSEPDGSLVIAKLTHDPYTGYIPTEAPNGFVSNLSIQKVKHKRYTMEDIAGLETRINNVEYYTSLSLLEQNAQSLQISDPLGLNRFKNGILVDDFSSYATADTSNGDYAATINRRTRQLTATQTVNNFPFKSLAQVSNMGLLSQASETALGYAVNPTGYVNYFSLPFTTANVVSQKIASRTVNVNPFSYAIQQGLMTLSPNVDNWVDTKYAPSLLITDPNLQVFQANSAALNVLSAGDWQTVSGTSVSTNNGNTIGHGINPSPFGNVGYNSTTTVTTTNQVQSNIIGAYDKIGNTYSLNNGYITDISVLPFIRSQQVVVRAQSLLFYSTLNAYFDNTPVNNYIRRGNVIELTSVTGTFNNDDVIGYTSGGQFYPTGRVISVYNYTNTSNVRLYVAADQGTTNYAPSNTLQNAYFDINGLNPVSTASGTINIVYHRAGSVNTAISTTQIKLSPMASSTSNVYAGNTLYIVAGTGAGQSAMISSYSAANQVAYLASSITTANGDAYSIGTMKSNENGAFAGIFNLPANQFHTGQRVLRLDNSIAGNQNTATTYAEGTYYAEGLSVTSQSIDFGASPAGAKNTFTQTNQQSTNNIVTTYSPWDPVAQTFIIDKNNYPNGIFLNSISIFFATKPANDNSPITLSVVGTQNGYPNGQTLDHSLVSLPASQIVVNTINPQVGDGNSQTVFNFEAPVYIQPGVMYAFILHSSSNEYTMWSASNGDVAINFPNTKIGSAPYVGALFLSQNSQTWTADQNQDLMFVMDQCVFNTTATPTLQFVLPKKLPQRTLINQSITYFNNANTLSNTIDSFANNDVLVDAFNFTTTDFTPTTTQINYSYSATLPGGTTTATTSINPGKYGTSSSDSVYLNDGNGERVLLANTNSSLSLYATISSTDPSVSPIISDAGLTAYAINWNINNCQLSNSLITVANTGSGYLSSGSGTITNSGTSNVTVSAPTGNGTTAIAYANVVSGKVTSVYFVNGGSGYLTTPTITIADPAGINANVTVTGETSKSGGPAIAKYVTKKVVLAAGNDSGDLNVYITAYRPINTDINVYYKILSRNDTQNFNDGQWQLMTKTNSSGAVYSQYRTDLLEYSFAPGPYTSGIDQGFVSYTSTNGQVYTSFSQFALKIVLTTTDKTAVPFLTDMRTIALPSTSGNPY